MRSLRDIISMAVAIFGPDYVARGGAYDPTSSWVANNDRAVQRRYRELCWIDYWRQMGVDDPEAAARTCLGYAHLGPWNAEMIRLRDASAREAVVPVVKCSLGRWPAHRVEIEPVTLDLTYGGVKVQEKVVKYIIKVDGKEIGTVDQYILET